MARSPLFVWLRQAIAQTQAQTRPSQARSGTLSRRRLLRYSALAAGTAIATTALLDRPMQGGHSAQAALRVAIVGGGLAGLNAAYQLQKLGILATVYEAKPYVGGRVQSQEGVAIRGLVNDLGGSFINTEHADMLALVDELWLNLFDRQAAAARQPHPEIGFYFDGRPIPAGELVANLREIATQIGQDAALLDEDFDTYVEVFDALSVQDYLDAHADKMPVRYVRSLLEAGIRTEYGVEPHAASALQLLYNLPTIHEGRVEPLSSDEVFLVQEGSGAIPQALAAKLEGQIRTRWRLEAIASQGEGYRLTFNQGTIEADYVILAMPFPALRRVDVQVELPDGLRRFIQEVSPGWNEKVFAGFSDRRWQRPDGFTGEAWTDLGYASLWEETQRQPEFRQGVLTFFLGASEVQAHGGKALDQGRNFVSQLNDWLPGVATAVGDRFHRTAWHQDPDIGGGYTNFKPGQYLEFSEFMYIESDDPAEQQDVHVGNLIFAGEQFSDEFYGYMNGAAQTGRLAAAVVARRSTAARTSS